MEHIFETRKELDRWLRRQKYRKDGGNMYWIDFHDDYGVHMIESAYVDEVDDVFVATTQREPLV